MVHGFLCTAPMFRKKFGNINTHENGLLNSYRIYIVSEMQRTPDISSPPSTKSTGGLTYTLLLILLLCTMPVLGSFAAALPLNLPPPPVFHQTNTAFRIHRIRNHREPLSLHCTRIPKPQNHWLAHISRTTL